MIPLIGWNRFNQWSGINSLAYFLPVTFERNIGLSTQLSLIISGVLGVQYFLVSWLPYFFIERAGRRVVMMYSAAGCSFCMVISVIMLEVDTLAVSLHFPSSCEPPSENQYRHNGFSSQCASSSLISSPGESCRSLGCTPPKSCRYELVTKVSPSVSVPTGSPILPLSSSLLMPSRTSVPGSTSSGPCSMPLLSPSPTFSTPRPLVAAWRTWMKFSSTSASALPNAESQDHGSLILTRTPSWRRRRCLVQCNRRPLIRLEMV